MDFWWIYGKVNLNVIKFYRISFTIFYKNNILIEYKHPAISCFLSKKKEIKKKTNEVEFHKF